jgi:hypothetical protein
MSTIDDLIPVQRDDRAWFAQNPTRQFRVRRAGSHEYRGFPPMGKRIFTIVHRDEITEWWEHEHFFDDQYLDTNTFTDDSIRKLLPLVTGGKKC